MKKWLNIAISAVFWIALWEGLYLFVDQSVILPSPLEVLLRLGEFITEGKFWLSVVTSLYRVLAGLVLGTVLGILIAVLTANSSFCKTLFAPILHIIKATPVASFIILAILWLDTPNVPIFTAMLIVLPAVWASTERGILSVDPMLKEMGRSFGLSKTEVFLRITLPSLRPFFIAALNSAVGMAWKAGIAAEVICPYRDSIGKALNDSKVYLETADTFAWTATVIVLSVLIEKLFLYISKKGGENRAQI